MEQTLTTHACRTCGLVQRVPTVAKGMLIRCARCESGLRVVQGKGVQVTAALTLAALVLYVPANIYPVLRVTTMGVTSDSTIWSGTRALAADGMWFVAAVVFIASIVVPLMKLLGLGVLVMTVRMPTWRRDRTRLWRLIEAVGRWSMLDVFLLAVLVAHLKLGEFATVVAGPGIVAFTGVVVLTMTASATFDPALIWKNSEANA